MRLYNNKGGIFNIPKKLTFPLVCGVLQYLRPCPQQRVLPGAKYDAEPWLNG